VLSGENAFSIGERVTRTFRMSYFFLPIVVPLVVVSLALWMTRRRRRARSVAVADIEAPLKHD
jgi:hypothetical protein